MIVLKVFFFSSRRRHTRCSRDWSSDVCSSDLAVRSVPVPRLLLGALVADEQGGRAVRAGFTGSRAARCRERRGDADYRAVAQDLAEDHDHRHPGALAEAHVTGRPSGVIALAAGIAGLAWCLRDFALVGRGTPAPFDPPQQLVATGLYRWVRNPMYLSALSLLVGEATRSPP